VYNIRGNITSLKLLYWVKNERFRVLTGILSMDISFTLKIMVRVEIPIIKGFVLRDALSMNLKLIIKTS